jgi:hypothetical protein
MPPATRTHKNPRQKSGPDWLTGRGHLVGSRRLFLLLALVVGLGRMLVSGLGLIECLSRLLLCARMIIAAVLLGGGPMRLCSLLVMFCGLLVHILRHHVSLLFGEG